MSLQPCFRLFLLFWYLPLNLCQLNKEKVGSIVSSKDLTEVLHWDCKSDTSVVQLKYFRKSLEVGGSKEKEHCVYLCQNCSVLQVSFIKGTLQALRNCLQIRSRVVRDGIVIWRTESKSTVVSSRDCSATELIIYLKGWLTRWEIADGTLKSCRRTL